MNGEHYCGFFIRNKFHGKGKLTFNDDELDGKQQFIGTFKNGKIDGHGTMTWTNGDSCKAYWIQNEQLAIKGTGLYIWSSGIKVNVTSSESGLVFDNRLIFPEKDFRKEYTGNCINGHVMHGEGILTLKSGRVYRGNWV